MLTAVFAVTIEKYSKAIERNESMTCRPIGYSLSYIPKCLSESSEQE